jgi:K+ transporter
MGKVKITIVLEEEIVEQTRILALTKHKLLKGGFSKIVEEALQYYIELNKENLGIKDLFSAHSLMHNVQKKKGISSENRLIQIINNILKAVKEQGIENEFTANHWVNACYKVGYADYRTINKYLSVAEKLGMIQNVRPGIFKIAGEKHEEK